jgi:glycosyltransferase involved in cell wall biosynthesis
LKQKAGQALKVLGQEALYQSAHETEMNQQIVLGHPFGNANVRQALHTFHEAGLLSKFITTISADHLPSFGFLPQSIRAEVNRRNFSQIPQKLIEPHPLLEALRLSGRKLSQKLSLVSNFFPTVDDVWRSNDNHVRNWVRKNGDDNVTVYAYEDGAFETFTTIRNAKKLYELPIGYWKAMHRILGEEKELKPEWSSTLTGLSDDNEKLERKDVELELADKIIVPSDFVARTLPSRLQKKIDTVPYGCPPVTHTEKPIYSPSGPLKVFFCGSLGQRKGISYLFESARQMGSAIDLTIVGSEVGNCGALNNELQRVTWHRSLPRESVLALMRQSDVFLFPTLFEGRALVVLEALSQGLPVITTENSGTTDLIEEGQSGFVVPIRSVEQICLHLENLYKDRHLLLSMKMAALETAANAGWDRYRLKLFSAANLTS